MKEADNNQNGSQETKHTDQQPVSGPRKSGVFMMRAKGQSWQEFEEACVRSLKEKGLLKQEMEPLSQSPKSKTVSNENPGGWTMEQFQKGEKVLKEVLKRHPQFRKEE